MLGPLRLVWKAVWEHYFLHLSLLGSNLTDFPPEVMEKPSLLQSPFLKEG